MFARRLVTLAILLAYFPGPSVANTEKTIFLGPGQTKVPTGSSPGFGDLNLLTLTPAYSSIRLTLPRSFPNSSHPKGLSSWFLLNNLEQGHRYEVRICWAATDPTEFWLNEHNVSRVFETPALINDLASFSEANDHDPQVVPASTESMKGSKIEGDQSLLFLQIHSAANYFNADVNLMKDPPPVLVDIILDPFIFNVFPQSLSSTAIYITVIAISSWFISSWIWRLLRDFAQSESDKEHGE